MLLSVHLKVLTTTHTGETHARVRRRKEPLLSCCSSEFEHRPLLQIISKKKSYSDVQYLWKKSTTKSWPSSKANSPLLWNSLRTTVDLLELRAEVGLGGFQRPGGQQVPLLQQVDRPQGLHLQLGDAAEAPQRRRQLREVGECLRWEGERQRIEVN